MYKSYTEFKLHSAATWPTLKFMINNGFWTKLFVGHHHQSNSPFIVMHIVWWPLYHDAYCDIVGDDALHTAQDCTLCVNALWGKIWNKSFINATSQLLCVCVWAVGHHRIWCSILFQQWYNNVNSSHCRTTRKMRTLQYSIRPRLAEDLLGQTGRYYTCTIACNHYNDQSALWYTGCHHKEWSKAGAES